MQNRVHAAEQRKEMQSRGRRKKRTHRRQGADQVGIGDDLFSSPLSSVSLSLSGQRTEQS